MMKSIAPGIFSDVDTLPPVEDYKAIQLYFLASDYKPARIFMPQNFIQSVILLQLLLLVMTSASATAAESDLTVHKIRTFFSGNVFAELGPCG